MASHPDPRPPASDGERALPEEIASAIEGLMHASFAAGSTNGAWAFRRREVAREALTTSILSRLTAAEAGREEAEARVEKLETALTWYVENDDVNLNDPGNEFWIDGYNRARALLPEAPPQGDP